MHAFLTFSAKVKTSMLYVVQFLLGNSPASCVLLADVSERSIGSIFIGRWMKKVCYNRLLLLLLITATIFVGSHIILLICRRITVAALVHCSVSPLLIRGPACISAD
jgi:hypothetical protein